MEKRPEETASIEEAEPSRDNRRLKAAILITAAGLAAGVAEIGNYFSDSGPRPNTASSTNSNSNTISVSNANVQSASTGNKSVENHLKSGSMSNSDESTVGVTIHN
jgi:hypothetical protein